jgi:hypothetical protein
VITFGGQDNTVLRYRGSYADPHSTIAIRDIPTNLKHIFRLTRFYYNQDALLGAIVDKMAEYPITQIIVNSSTNDELTPTARDKWEYLLNVVLNIRQVLIDINVDKYVYGNSFHYLYYPFVRYCKCQHCNERTVIGNLKTIRAIAADGKTSANDDFTFVVEGNCPKCKKDGRFSIEDKKSEARAGMHIVRLNPLSMELEFNPSSGHRRWYWDPPKRIKQAFEAGDRTIIDYTEMKVLAAAFRGQKLLVNRDRLWVSQAPQQPGLWEGWGIPPIFRVLEDVYYYKILRRANEALAQEHVVPLRIISPAGTGDVSPQRTMNLTDWRNRMRDELYSWKRDPNHLLLSPIPLNVEQIGGQARVMMVASEMEAAARVIAAGIGCPVEMIWGGLNWSGASVSLRVLENHFINDRENSERFLGFIIPKIAAYFRLPRVNTKLSEFKMADDVQQQATAVNLMMQGFLSRESVVGEMGYDPTEEFQNMANEHERLNSITMKDNVAASHMNIVIQALEAKASVLLQYELQVTQQEIKAQSERERLKLLREHVAKLHAAGYTTPLEFEQSATVLGRVPPQLAAIILQEWSTTMPNTVLLLQEKMRLNQLQAANAAQAMQTAQGAADPGAVTGEQSSDGAEGPYSAGGDGSGGAEAAATAQQTSQETSAGLPTNQEAGGLPEQRPPRRAVGGA